MTHILFRCDASLSIGSGHVIRCRTLARVLQQRGAEITFLCRHQSGDLICLLKQEFHVLSLLKRPLTNCEGLEGRKLYAAWLGCTQDQDAEECLTLIAQAATSKINWLVVDHYGIDSVWEERVIAGLNGEHSIKLLAIDDLADRQHRADVLLDQNFFGNDTEKRYSGLLPDHCRQLLGPHYALLGPEYAHLHPLVPQRSELRRVLVFFGGVDPMNLTSRSLEALMSPDLASLAVDVVLGMQSTNRQEVEELTAQRPNTTLHDPLPSLAGLIARADLAIGAGGSTTWERACLGLPSIVVAIASNQLPFAQALHQEGELRLLGSDKSVGSEQIRHAITESLEKIHIQSSGQRLTDGWGAERLSIALLGIQSNLRLKPASSLDESLLLRWANDPQVRQNSKTPQPIKSRNHTNWFKTSLSDPNRLILIASDAQGCPLGQIRFDRKSMSEESSQAFIDLSLDRCARGRGLGKELLILALKCISTNWGPNIEAIAEVFETNISSQSTFSKAGFTLDKSRHSNSSSPENLTRWRWRSDQRKTQQQRKQNQ